MKRKRIWACNQQFREVSLAILGPRARVHVDLPGFSAACLTKAFGGSSHDSLQIWLPGDPMIEP